MQFSTCKTAGTHPGLGCILELEFKSAVFEASCHADGCQIDHANDGPVEVITMAHIIPYHISDDTLEYIAWNGTNIVMNKLG